MYMCMHMHSAYTCDRRLLLHLHLARRHIGGRLRPPALRLRRDGQHLLLALRCQVCRFAGAFPELNVSSVRLQRTPGRPRLRD